MIKKRFLISQGYADKFCHDWEKKKLLNFRQTVSLLNSFYEENEQLKETNVKLVELLSDIGLKTDTALKLLYEK